MRTIFNARKKIVAYHNENRVSSLALYQLTFPGNIFQPFACTDRTEIFAQYKNNALSKIFYYFQHIHDFETNHSRKTCLKLEFLIIG